MTALCGDKYPAQNGVYCTRSKTHQGGHLNKARNIYWPAREPAVELAERLRRQADRRMRLADAAAAAYGRRTA